MKDIVKICHRTIEYSFYLLFFLTPLILTPWNHELFEFNKMIFVYFLTILIVAAWLIKMVCQGRIIFRHTFMDIPFLLFLTSQFASTLLSIDRHTSFWGYYSRFHGGLASTICYLLLYWAFVNNMRIHPNLNSPNKSEYNKTKYSDKIFGLFPIRIHSDGPNQSVVNCLIALLSSGFLVASYGILEHFGIDAQYWVQDVQNRVFSTLGQPNWLAAWLVAIMPLTWSFALRNQRTKKLKNKETVIAHFNPRANRRLKSANPIYYLLFTIYYLCLLYAKSRSGFLGFGITYLVFWLGTFWLHCHRPQNILKPFLLITGYSLLITFLIGSPWTPSAKDILTKFSSPSSPPTTTLPAGRQADSLPTSHSPLLISESSDIRKVVWQGAIDIWRHYPIFGTGVETFAYSYYWHRPREHNDLSEWDFLYNKAHNEYLNFAATTGLVGLGSYLVVIGVFGWWVISKCIRIRIKIVRMNSPNKSKNSDKIFGLFPIRIDSDKKLSSKNQADRILILGLLAGYLSILVTNFFGFSVVPVALLFFLYPALALSTLGEYETSQARKPLRKTGKRQWFGKWFGIGLILLFTFYFLLFTFKYWYADFLFAQGEKFNHAGQYDQASQSLQRAIITRPGEPTYHNEFALVLSNLAMKAYEQEENSQFARELAEMAVFESDQALKISPYHLNFWKNRTRILHQLGEIEEKYLQMALVSLLRASEVAPTDAKIFYNLALLYAQVGQDQTAIKTLEKTVLLKPNYADARYALSLFYEKEEKIKEAKLQLEYILEKINPQHESAREKLESL